MAFQQSARQVAPRLVRVESPNGEPAAVAAQTYPGPTESQTWVLFTPGTDAGTTTSYLSSVQDDQLTPGRSRISDLGSLDTAARSELNLQAPSDVIEESVAEEDAELDSLDSHLPEFRAASSPYNQPHEVPHATTVLPGHDGLGSFRFEAPRAGAEAQERLYAFERYNPNRVRARGEAFTLAQLELETEEAQEAERTRRIEAWRLEQSQLLLDDIRRETRRRRQSEASVRQVQRKPGAGSAPPDAAARSVADEEAADVNLGGSDWHDQDEPALGGAKPGLWSRIARTLICDLIGIDEKVLAMLFGDAEMPDDKTQPAAQAPAADASSYDADWQLRMLDRIARELGMLVHRLSAHPSGGGAFSTYTRVQHAALPYAGLPAIPEASAEATEGGQGMEDSAPSMPQFRPTVGRPADLLSRRPSEPATVSAPSVPEGAGAGAGDAQHTFTQQEWEQDLDVRLVFRYLRSRFASSRQSPPSFSAGTGHLATSSTQEAAAKAARVRQHHPLVSHAHAHAHAHPHGHGYHHHHHHHHRPRPVERRSFKAAASPTSPVAARHGPGSCASQSTRRSARRSSMSSRPSSRHYWDIGGSIGTGSAIASTGPMGSWGEV